MPLLAAGAMYGSMAMVMQPKMLRSIVENTKQNAFFKAEGPQINIGLGKGKALEIFNSNIFKFRQVE